MITLQVKNTKSIGQLGQLDALDKNVGFDWVWEILGCLGFWFRLVS